jgi:predicted nucleotidyltransferase
MEEKIIRQVTGIGNGAHIFAPKEWLGEEVIIVKTPRKDPKEEILKIIYPHLDKIIAVFLFGSYAREEQEKDSDMDLFIISDEKLKIKSKNIDIIVVPEEKIEMAKKINPILFYSMLEEAKQIINPSYLKKLKREKINFEYFKDFLEETKKSIDSSKEIIEMDKKLKSKESSESIVYSSILRLRGIFIINLLLENKRYSKKIFKEWIIKNSSVDYDKTYEIYRAIRDNKKTDKKISMKEGESLLSMLIKETENTSRRIK